MNKEQRFLIEVTKLDIDKEYFSNIQNTTGLDWEYIFNQASKHAILQFIFYHLNNTDIIPKKYFELLKSHCRMNQIQNLRLINEFKNVLNCFSTNGIKVIVLKGVYLSKQVYPEVYMRPFGDMDILISEDDKEKVFNILKDLGYKQAEVESDSGEVIEFNEERLEGYSNELQHYGEFIKIVTSPLKAKFSIDVHHRLSTIFDNFSYDIPKLLQRSVKDKIDDIPIYRLDNEDFLTHLCTHLYWHTQSIRDILDGEDARLLSYCDIYSFINSHNIDWKVLFERVQGTGIDKALYYSLYHCHLIFGNVVPNEVYKSWEQVYLVELSNSICDRWITRNANKVIAKWPEDFLVRLFNEQRANIALRLLYTDYIEPILHRGGILKIIERSQYNI